MAMKEPLMKRAFSFLLLFLMGLSSIGYYGILLMTKRELARQIVTKIDENANEIGGDLILKIPVPLPYLVDSREYERTDGEINYEGEVYRFIKRRLYHDTLFIVCVRDPNGTAVNNLISEYSKSLSSETQEQSPALKLFGSLSKYYVLYGRSSVASHRGWEQAQTFGDPSEVYAFTLPVNIFHPPQFQAVQARI